MNYCFSKSINNSFQEAKAKTIEALKQEGFGVLTEINVQETLKKKLNVDFYKYEILGACNPAAAYEALKAEDKIGTMLPCNVIIQQKMDGGPVEVSAIDPVASMMAIENNKLASIAKDVQGKLKRVIDAL